MPNLGGAQQEAREGVQGSAPARHLQRRSWEERDAVGARTSGGGLELAERSKLGAHSVTTWSTLGTFSAHTRPVDDHVRRNTGQRSIHDWSTVGPSLSKDEVARRVTCKRTGVRSDWRSEVPCESRRRWHQSSFVQSDPGATTSSTDPQERHGYASPRPPRPRLFVIPETPLPVKRRQHKQQHIPTQLTSCLLHLKSFLFASSRTGLQALAWGS